MNHQHCSNCFLVPQRTFLTVNAALSATYSFRILFLCEKLGVGSAGFAMNPRNPPPIRPILAGYYDLDEQTPSPAVYASRRAALHEYTRQRFAVASLESGATPYGISPLQHEMGGLDVLYASSDLLERAPGDAAGHQAIGNALWQEDNLWRVAARGCLHFPDQVMLSRGLILPALVPNLPADTYLLVRKLGSGKVIIL